MHGFKTLRPGDNGPMTELLQLGLRRAGLDAGQSGEFGADTAAALKQFHARAGIPADAAGGISGSGTWRALMPYLTGFVTVTAEENDSIEKLARSHDADPAAVYTANPALQGGGPAAGQTVTVPLDFDVVPTDIRFTSVVLSLCVDGLLARYPFLEDGDIGISVMGRPIRRLTLGKGGREVLYNAAHHANEWITSPLLMKFLEDYASACASGSKIFDIDALTLYSKTTLNMVPMVNPDGVDLVTGLICGGPYYDHAAALSRTNPGVCFPSGWKANISGADLNLQYPAGWENAAAVKKAQGILYPGPRDYVGPAPLSEPESRALYRFTRAHDFALTLSYHTQGKVIYWKYLDFEPKNSYETALDFAAASGYAVEETPIVSGYAGYKDWFISSFDRPGYTIEAGEGASPLPLSQFSAIYKENLGILTLGLRMP